MPPEKRKTSTADEVQNEPPPHVTHASRQGPVSVDMASVTGSSGDGSVAVGFRRRHSIWVERIRLKFSIPADDNRRSMKRLESKPDHGRTAAEAIGHMARRQDVKAQELASGERHRWLVR